jgi:hypothetical protein
MYSSYTKSEFITAEISNTIKIVPYSTNGNVFFFAPATLQKMDVISVIELHAKEDFLYITFLQLHLLLWTST